MSFRRTFKDKLHILKKAGLPQDKEHVTLLNSVSRKNRKQPFRGATNK